MQRKVPGPLQRCAEVLGQSRLPRKASRVHSPNHGDKEPWAGYKHCLAVSNPILLSTGQISLFSLWHSCLKMMFLLLFGTVDSDLPWHPVPNAPERVTFCPEVWPCLQSLPPSSHFPPTAKIPFCFHSICYHIQITRAPELWTQSCSPRLFLSCFLG